MGRRERGAGKEERPRQQAGAGERAVSRHGLITTWPQLSPALAHLPLVMRSRGCLREVQIATSLPLPVFLRRSLHPPSPSSFLATYHFCFPLPLFLFVIYLLSILCAAVNLLAFLRFCSLTKHSFKKYPDLPGFSSFGI